MDPSARRSPLIVSQEGCAPNDPLAKTKLFYLQRDGEWIDEVAHSTRPDLEAGDIIFDSPGEPLKLLSSLFGKPVVRNLPTTDADVEAYIARAKAVTSPVDAYREFLARYRAAKAKA